MAKMRKEGPKGQVFNVHVSERLVVEQEWDKKNPKFKHMWASVDAKADALARQHKEIVHDDDGNIIANGVSQLVRQPREIYDGAMMAKEEGSRAQIEAMNANVDGTPFIDEELTMEARPKRRKG